ncbi:MAG: DUF4123 domain-containing protein, partial [Gemmataceae bacterium]
MEMSLVVQTGDDAGRAIRIAATGTTRVGRSAPCEVLLSHDAMLSNEHFQIRIQDNVWTITDSKSRFGTLVNGTKIVYSGLKDGDVIKAGRTEFTVTIVGAAAAPESVNIIKAPALEPPDIHTTTTGRIAYSTGAPAALRTTVIPGLPQDAPVKQRVQRMLAAQPRSLFVILDAARDTTILERVRESKLESQCLYDGAKGDELEAFGPWLVALPQETPILEEWVREGWGGAWGVYLTTDLSFAEVRQHLRKFLMVK